MKTNQFEAEIDYVASDPAILRMMAESPLCAALGIKTDDTVALQMLTKGMLLKFIHSDKFDSTQNHG